MHNADLNRNVRLSELCASDFHLLTTDFTLFYFLTIFITLALSPVSTRTI